jgi:ubiquinone/menaquinone biosynthesis C-methylase UbiE
MSGMASRKLRAIGGPINLCRGRAQRLPFKSSNFGTLVSTFPSDYIFDPDTLSEAYRVLSPKGILIVIAYVKITGTSVIDILLRWAFRITGQSNEDGQIRILERFGDAGFDARFDVVQVKRAEVFRILAVKSHDQSPAPG